MRSMGSGEAHAHVCCTALAYNGTARARARARYAPSSAGMRAAGEKCKRVSSGVAGQHAHGRSTSTRAAPRSLTMDRRACAHAPDRPPRARTGGLKVLNVSDLAVAK